MNHEGGDWKALDDYLQDNCRRFSEEILDEYEWSFE